MTLNDQDKSKVKQDIDNGEAKVAGETRKVMAGVRKTAIGKAIAHQSEKQRMQSEQIMKANIKQKKDMKKGEDDSDWESVEEDAPVVRLEELLNNMKIDGDAEDEESKEE